MKLEQQVVSLELAKRLKELGVKQESLYWWNEKAYRITRFEKRKSHYTYLNEGSSEEHGTREIMNISAFTVAELGEMLKWKIFYIFGLPEELTNLLITDKDTEAEVRAKMLIYLLENNLIPKEGNDG